MNKKKSKKKNKRDSSSGSGSSCSEGSSEDAPLTEKHDDDDDDDVEEEEDLQLCSSMMTNWIVDFGALKIREKIGTGSCGECMVAGFKGVEIVFKKFPRQTRTVEFMIELRAEVGQLAQLSHLNIVRLLGMTLQPAGLVYEHAGEFNANAIIAARGTRQPRRVLTTDMRVEVVRQTAAGLAYLHDCGVVHGNLNPSNIILDGEGFSIKLADYALRTLRDGNRTMTVCADPSWMAPECMSGKEHDARSDIYMLGLLAWAILAGRIPFEEDMSFMEVAGHILDGGRPSLDKLPDGTPKDLVDLIRKCWKADPKKRPKSSMLTNF